MLETVFVVALVEYFATELLVMPSILALRIWEPISNYSLKKKPLEPVRVLACIADTFQVASLTVYTQKTQTTNHMQCHYTHQYLNRMKYDYTSSASNQILFHFASVGSNHNRFIWEMPLICIKMHCNSSQFSFFFQCLPFAYAHFSDERFSFIGNGNIRPWDSQTNWLQIEWRTQSILWATKLNTIQF